MVRVRFARDPDAWTDWHYFPPAGYQLTTTPEVDFAYAYDFSDMSVPAMALVDVVQMANLIASDRIDTANSTLVGTNLVGSGRVVFDNSTSIRPDAGTNDTDRVFGSSTYDPDPLYVASLHSVVEMLPPVLGIVQRGGDVEVSWPLLSLLQLQAATVLNGPSTVWETVTNVSVGTNRINATLNMTNGAQFFRLHRPW